jgi:class 3 adenylate cyclase
MVAGNQLVDLAIDPHAEGVRRRRAWIRGGLWVAILVLMVGAILAIAVYTDRANRQGVLALSDDLLAALDSRIAFEVSAYLGPATRATRIVRGMLAENALTHPLDAQETAAVALREVPQITNLNFADQDGNFILVRRGLDRGTEVKLIENAPGPRRVTWIYRDPAGTETRRREDPSDSYDPRQRPWYIGAVDSDELFWTNAYVFYTDRKPGITVSARYRGPDGRVYVYGVDIALDQISRFLASLQIGQHGKAVLMSGSGDVIASPTGTVMVEQGKDNFVPAKVDALGDPVLTRAYDLFRAEGAGRHIEDLNGTRYIMTATPLTTGGRDWIILLTVPEDDFIGFLASSNRPALIMSLLIVFVAAVLAVLLLRQGRRADRTARLLAERQRAVAGQSAAFAKVATDPTLFDPARKGPPDTLTEALIEVTGGRRASVLRLVGDRLLSWEDSCEHGSVHVKGQELHRDEIPHFIAAIEKGEDFRVPDAAKDRRTAEFYRIVMQPFGTRALLVMPIHRESTITGAVVVEDSPQAAAHQEAIRDFVRALAQVSASCMSERSTPAATRPAASATRMEAATVQRVAGGLDLEGIDPAKLEASIYPEAAVMVLQLTDVAAMALRPNSEGRSLTDELVRRAQSLAEEHHLPYLKLVGHELYAAAGLGNGSTAAPAQIADAALVLRDCCMGLFEETSHAPAFRIGVDCGPALGSRLGAGPEIFNLWGDAVQTADAMASSAMAGTVQVSEAAYQRLRGDFLFRPRGRFYLPRRGEAETFILASRS